MKELPSLDAHAHLDHAQTVDELADSGSVLAMTLSLEEAALAIDRHDPQIVWGGWDVIPAGLGLRNRLMRSGLEIWQSELP